MNRYAYIPLGLALTLSSMTGHAADRVELSKSTVSTAVLSESVHQDNRTTPAEKSLPGDHFQKKALPGDQFQPKALPGDHFSPGVSLDQRTVRPKRMGE